MGIVHTYSTSTEIKSDLIVDRAASEARIERVTKSFIESWYSPKDTGGKDMVFDKSRGWLPNVPALWKIYPDAKIVVTVRDPRAVLGSIEKQNNKFPLLDANKEKSITKRVEDFFGDEGMVGAPMRAIEDALRRKWPVFYMKYEQLMDTPKSELSRLHDYIGIGDFRHDLDNIKNTATDVDALYNFKYPHEGCGRLQPSRSDEWRDYVSDEVGNVLLARFPVLCQHFGYK